MRTTVEILDALKRRLSVTSDYALAVEMGWSRARVSSYRTGRTYLDDFAAVQVAERLSESPLKLIAIVNAERTKRPEQKKRWQELAKASIFATALIGGGFLIPTPSQASTTSTVSAVNDVYIMRRRRRGPFYNNLPKDPALSLHA